MSAIGSEQFGASGNSGATVPSEIINYYIAAFKLYTESLRLRREVGDQLGAAIALHGLGLIAMAEGRRDDARASLRESLAIFAEAQEMESIGEDLWVHGARFVDSQEHVKATRLFGASEALRNFHGYRLTDADRVKFDRTVGLARVALGEDAFAPEWAIGLAMQWEQAVAYTLASSVDAVSQLTSSGGIL